MLSRGGRPDVRKIKSFCGGWTASEAEVGGWVEEAFAQWMKKKLFGDIMIAVGVGESRAGMLRGEFRKAPRILLGEITSTKGRPLSWRVWKCRTVATQTPPEVSLPLQTWIRLAGILIS